MKRLLMLTVLSAITAMAEMPTASVCTSASDTQRTHWGHQQVVIDLQSKPSSTMAGTVFAAYKHPVEGALVEVYHYDGSRLPQPSDKPDFHQRVAACVTGARGLFEFALPAGRYEIRVSKAGWNSTSALVVLDKTSRKQRFAVPLHIGT